MVRFILSAGVTLTILLSLLISTTSIASARACGNTSKGFNSWLSSFKKEMKAKGFSNRAVNASLQGVKYNHRVIRLDRSQKSFKQSFDVFYKRRTKGMVRIGRKKMKRYAKTFKRVEKKYGVPAPLLTSIWGLETAFGTFMGKKDIMSSLATLSYDCRRSAFFTAELIAAIKIVNDGHLTRKQMRGAWAGEIGQTQFLATRFVDYAIDFDGNNKIDLYRSVPDVLASTAAWFKGNGWKSEEGWKPGSHNYEVIAKWNKARVYQKTISRLADELAK
ncbi:lytic murein transglycosylase [Hyphomicrobiales bacterium 4NK60-0047b]